MNGRKEKSGGGETVGGRGEMKRRKRKTDLAGEVGQLIA